MAVEKRYITETKGFKNLRMGGVKGELQATFPIITFEWSATRDELWAGTAGEVFGPRRWGVGTPGRRASVSFKFGVILD